MTDMQITEADNIRRDRATRPWSLDEQTEFALDDINGIHDRIDSVHVPWGATEPIMEVECTFTVDERVIDRRDGGIADVLAEVVRLVESDRRLDEYIEWDKLTASAVTAQIDESHTRVRVRWDTASNGGEN